MKAQRWLVIVCLFLLAPAVVVLAEDLPWPGGMDPVRVSPYEEARRPSLALASGKTALAWYGADAHAGIYVSEWSGAWNSGASVRTITTSSESKFPSLVYSGTQQLLVAWLEGAGPNDPNTIFHQEVGKPAPVAVMPSVYGEAAPDQAVGSKALHLAFAAAQSKEYATQMDLYYVQRALNTTTWGAPTVVFTRSQVTREDVGGIWSPQMALTQVDQTQTVHLVWEQTTATISRTVWYVQGTQQGSSVVWQSPVRLSPAGQMAVRPSIVADADDQIHVVWSEIAAGTEAIPTAQYINYRRLFNGVWSSPTRIDPDPISINTLFPTKSTPQIAVSGDQICVAWHGYRGTGSSKEDIFLRCSRNGGLSWEYTFNVSEDADALSLFPTLQMDALKQVHVAWQNITVGPVTYKGAFYRMGTVDFRVLLPVVLRNKG